MKLLKKRKWLMGSFIAASLLALSACGAADNSTGDTKEANHAGQKSGDSKYHIRVGYLKANGAPLADIADYEGFFKKENLDVEFVPFNSSTDGVNALQSNKIDVGLTFGTTTPLAFIAQGADLDIVGGHMEGGHPVYIPKEDIGKYKSFADFKGKTIGVVPLGVPDVVFKSALKKAGVDLEKDVKFVEFKTVANLIDAAGARKVDIAFGNSGFLSKAKSLGLEPFAWSNDVQPGHVCCRAVTRGDISKTDSVAYKKFLKGLIQAERVKQDSPETALKASKERIKLDDKTVNEIVNEKHLVNSADPSKKQVVKLWDEMKQLGYLKDGANVNLNKHFNLKFYEEALNELIKENPDDDYYKKILERYKQQNL